MYYQWDDAFLVFLLLAHHGIWLPGPSLPIGKDTDVVSLKSMQKHFIPYVFINLLLACKVHIFWLLKTEMHKAPKEIIINVSITAIMITEELKIAGLHKMQIHQLISRNSPLYVTNTNSQSWSSCSPLAVLDLELLENKENMSLRINL